MRIAVLGAGNIGATIGLKWAQAGHEVRMGVRDPGAPKYSDLKEGLPDTAQLGTAGEALEPASVVLLAIPGASVAVTVADYGALLAGKILIDATNNVGAPVMNNIAALTEAVPDAQVFRTFNYLGWENFADPGFGTERADLFYCGMPGQGQEILEDLIRVLGLRPVYIGDLSTVQILDNLTNLWFALALRQGHGRHLAFKMLGDLE